MDQSRKAALLLGLIALTALATGLGRSAAVQAQSNQPTVTSVTPAFGSAQGTHVTITGEHFAPDQRFKTDGGQMFTNVSCASTTRCTATTPVLSVADGDVTTFRTLAVEQTAAQSNMFTAYGRPVLDGINPNSGPVSGGNTVTLAGGAFPNGAALPGPVSVHFGSTQITDVTCSTISSICTVIAPAGTGTVAVTITTPGGTSAPQRYTYAPVAVKLITPTYSPAAGGAAVTILGSGFETAAGDTQFTNQAGIPLFKDVVCSSTTQCTATALPKQAPHMGAFTSPVYAVVNGVQSSSSQLFIWYGQPGLTKLSPNSGPADGVTVVTLSGGVFPSVAPYGGSVSVRFGDKQAVAVDCPNFLECRAQAPAGSGTVQVTITTPGGTSNALPFTYTGSAAAPAAPTVPVRSRCSRWSGPLALIVPWQNCTG